MTRRWRRSTSPCRIRCITSGSSKPQKPENIYSVRNRWLPVRKKLRKCKTQRGKTACCSWKRYAARENGVLLMEAFAYLHSPLIAAIKAELDRGAIGEVCYLENAFITSDYDLSNIRMRRETLGGSLYDLGCYCISQSIWLLGEPESVHAVADFSDQGVDRLTTGMMSYANGVQAAFTCGMTLATGQNRRLDRLQIHGTKGVLRTDAEYNQAGRLSFQIITDGQVVTRYVDVPQNYSLEIAQLGCCIASGEQPHVSADFTLATARTLDKALTAIGY